MDLVGVALARAGYASVQEREYPVILLIGGSRIPFDLTGLMGAESTDHKLEHLRDVMPTRPPSTWVRHPDRFSRPQRLAGRSTLFGERFVSTG